MPLILVDSTIPMYLVGGPHPNLDRARELVAQSEIDGEELVTDVEVYQEILHRYTAINRLSTMDRAFATLDEVVARVFSYDMDDVRLARAILREVSGIQARDAIHAAIMRNRGIVRIMSHDRGFDRIPGIERIF